MNTLNINKFLVNEIGKLIKTKCLFCYLLLSNNCKCLENCNVRLHNVGRITPEITTTVYRFIFINDEVFITLNDISVYYLSWCLKNKLKYFIELNSLDIDIHHLFQNLYDSLLIKAIGGTKHGKTKHTNNCTGLEISQQAKVIFNLYNNLIKIYQPIFKIKPEKDIYEDLFLDLLYMTKTRRKEKSKNLFELNQIKSSTFSFLDDYGILDLTRNKMEYFIKQYNKDIKYIEDFEIKEDEEILERIFKLQERCEPYIEQILNNKIKLPTQKNKPLKIS